MEWAGVSRPMSDGFCIHGVSAGCILHFGLLCIASGVMPGLPPYTLRTYTATLLVVY